MAKTQAFLVRTIETIIIERIVLTEPEPRQPGEIHNDWVDRAEKLARQKRGQILRESGLSVETSVPIAIRGVARLPEGACPIASSLDSKAARKRMVFRA